MLLELLALGAGVYWLLNSKSDSESEKNLSNSNKDSNLNTSANINTSTRKSSSSTSSSSETRTNDGTRATSMNCGFSPETLKRIKGGIINYIFTFDSLTKKITANAPASTPKERGIRYLALKIIENAVKHHNLSGSDYAPVDIEFYLLDYMDWERYAWGG